jgi:hypothetical protein
MNALLSLLTFRSFLTFASTGFVLLIIAISLNIITVHEIAQILGLSSTVESALNNAVIELQSLLGNATDIISQLLHKLLNWAGVDADMSKLKAAPRPVLDISSGISDTSISQ